MTFSIRKPKPDDAKPLAKILALGVKIDMPFLPVLHTDEENFEYMNNTILKNYRVLVAANEHDDPIGFIGFKDGWVHQLFVLNQHQGNGIGSALIKEAKKIYDELRLWTMQKSTNARAFYEAQGFKPIKFTDGESNEENEPDVLYHWRREI